ncbi:hypothetical protein [Alteromonas sp. 14N.309.X.WAT.G.H12]|uniref:hypothetical protein n=1 Tax=Alteromonas sp. 14N.309.X.WAT.G.H12 TaxID=3120824 RepID=UPI002FCF960F
MKPMILATGMQSGGTTLVSAAFLKHPDLDGILDMASDRIEVNLSQVTTPVTWVKMTTIAYRWQEVASVYAMYGYKAYPLMIVRNPFDVWVSLKKKWYGLNGLTAEDPPLAIRFLRFLEDWKAFQKSGYPIIQFEHFIEDPTTQIRAVMDRLPVNFDANMVNGETDLNAISYVSESNASFVQSLSLGASNTVAFKQSVITKREANWICEHLSDYIGCYGYTNKHSLVDETINELKPFPFDNRRFLGFGSQALARKTSTKYPELLAMARKKRQQGMAIAIYGACDFGEYLANFLTENDLEVACFFDSFAKPGTSVGDHQVSTMTSNNYFVIVASLGHRTEIKEKLLNEGVSEHHIFTFEEF